MTNIIFDLSPAVCHGNWDCFQIEINSLYRLKILTYQFPGNRYIFIQLMMKQFLVTILAFLYLATSTGATVHMHYCMGKLVNYGLLEGKNDRCGKCGMKKTPIKKKGCCNDEQKQIKLANDQKTAESAIQLMQSVAVDLPVSFMEIPSNHFSSIAEANPISHAPPPDTGVAVYIRNCSFLI